MSCKELSKKTDIHYFNQTLAKFRPDKVTGLAFFFPTPLLSVFIWVECNTKCSDLDLIQSMMLTHRHSEFADSASGDDSDTGHTRASDRHGKRCCHGSRLPARCQLWHRRGDREVHLCHSRCQRGPVLLDTGGGYRQIGAEEGTERTRDNWI